MARWIQNVQLSDPTSVGYTRIAGWWPTTYYVVMTLETPVASATDGIGKLTRLLHEMAPDNCGTALDYYTTLVQKSDQYGIAKHPDRPECQIEYPTREEALIGHNLIVEALAQGRWHLLRLVSRWKRQHKQRLTPAAHQTRERSE